MSPLPNFKSNPPSVTPVQSWSITALILALSCLVLGGAAVAWRAKVRASDRRAHAEVLAAVAGSVLDLGLRQGLGSAEMAAAFAAQPGGSLAQFQKMAGDWLAAHPGIAFVELAPGGVVSDVVPRRGNEQRLGRNLPADPQLAAAAQEAMRKRAPVLTASLLSPSGEAEVLVCAPAFQSVAGAREAPWGLVVASMRLRDVLAPARLEELACQGYDYVLFAPAAAHPTSAIFASHGGGSFRGAPQRSIRIQNLELRLAVRPQPGLAWVKPAFEFGGVVLSSALIGLLAQLLTTRNAKTQLFQREGDRGARIEVEVEGLREENRAAKERLEAAQKKLAQAQMTREQAESQAADLRSRLDESLGRAETAKRAGDSERAQAEAKLAELQARLDAGLSEAQESTKARAAELEEARKQLGQARKKAAETEARMAADFRAEKEAAEDLRDRLERQQSANADLQSRLEAATRSASQAEARVEELTALLTQVPKVAERTHDGSGTKAAVRSEIPVKPPRSELSAKAVELVAPSPPAESRETPARVEPLQAKRKKPRRDGQMDLFMTNAPEADKQSQSVAPETAKSSRRVPVATVQAPQESAKSVTELPSEAEPAPSPSASASADAVPQAGGEIGPARRPGAGAADGLPAAEGLDTTEGLASCGGDPKAYLRALDHFVEQQVGAARKIRDVLVQGDLAEAERRLRGLKLAAAEIGASRLQDATVAVSRSLQEQRDSSEVEFAWADLEKVLSVLIAELKPALKAEGEKPAVTRKLPPPPPVNPPVLRKALNEILPLFTGQDPGAKDCLKANRTAFRSAFSPEGYVEFEQTVRGGNYDAALEHLKKAVKKHGLTI